MAIGDPLNTAVLDDLRFMTGGEVVGGVAPEDDIERRGRGALRHAAEHDGAARRRDGRGGRAADAARRGDAVDLADTEAMATRRRSSSSSTTSCSRRSRTAPATSTSSPSRTTSGSATASTARCTSSRRRRAHLALPLIAASRSWRTSTSPRRACRRTGASSSRSAAAPVDLRVSHAADDVRRGLRDARARPQSAVAPRPHAARAARGRDGDHERLIELPHGIVLVTGPTGSGKTTTLYPRSTTPTTWASRSSRPRTRSSTTSTGIVQVQVNEEIGVTYAAVPAHRSCARTPT